MKVLIIGLGSIATKHAASLKRIDPDVKLFALRTKSDQTVDGIRNVTDVQEIPADVDFVIISNPTSLHAQTIERFVEMGKPLFIEKPLASRLSDAQLAAAAISQRSMLAYIAYPLRFHQLLQELKATISPDLGRVEEVSVYNGSYLPNWRRNMDFRLSYSADPELGGGVHLDMSHEIDLVYWLFGKPESSRALLRNKSSLGIDSYDYANYRLLYPKFCASIVLNYYRSQPCRTIDIVMPDKVIQADVLAGTIKINGAISYTFSGKLEDMYEAQLRYFIDAIKTGSPVMNNITEAIDVMNLILCEHETEG